MKVGLIGKRSSGKTTLFEAVSGIDTRGGVSVPLVGVSSVKVKDSNIDYLCDIFKPNKKTYAEFSLLDFNRSQDTATGSLGSSALTAKYRELDVIVIVVGVIDDLEFVISELNDILYELNIQDTLILDTKIQRMKKTKFDKQEMSLYENILNDLESGKPLSVEQFSKEQLKQLSSFQLFALKPKMLAINVTEDLLSLSDYNLLNDISVPYMLISAEIEKELKHLPDAEQKDFLKELGIDESVASKFVNMVYKTMNLISFYTVGSDEVRAWSIEKGLNAQGAAGKIHSDIERGFIRAETISYNTFMEYKDEVKAKAAGVVKSEGKEYIVNHGDIIHFKFNV